MAEYPIVTTLRTLLWRQFGAAISMVGNSNEYDLTFLHLACAQYIFDQIVVARKRSWRLG